MLALIPYFSPPVYNIYGIALDSWSILVSLGFIVGLEMSRSRAIRLGLDIKDIVDGGLFIVGMGFVFGHLVHVLAYNPHLIDEKGWVILIKIWAGFSSNGGFLGAIIGPIVWFNWVRPRPFWLHADTIAFGLPFGWFFGRLGCFTAHDHVGRSSEFALAVDFPDKMRFRVSERVFEQLDPNLMVTQNGCPTQDGVWDTCMVTWEVGARHDLGLYEAIYVFGIALVFWFLRKRSLRCSSFAMLFCLLYAPVRFGLDFLRNTDLPNSDLRWAGFTPAQYGSMFLFVAGWVLFFRLKERDEYVFTQRKKAPKEKVDEPSSDPAEREVSASETEP
ncbi:MAG: prolipoprotein diacylglyceryl transferase family protein [Myxococcota bacterium]|nr:prolipoprotein diacylglyceryl transferase family protein [Myxococcota bacterium]